MLFHLGDAFELGGYDIDLEHGTTPTGDVLHDDIGRVGKVSLQRLFDEITAKCGTV